jgi:hypothetical protein
MRKIIRVSMTLLPCTLWYFTVPLILDSYHNGIAAAQNNPFRAGYFVFTGIFIFLSLMVIPLCIQGWWAWRSHD